MEGCKEGRRGEGEESREGGEKERRVGKEGRRRGGKEGSRGRDGWSWRKTGVGGGMHGGWERGKE